MNFIELYLNQIEFICLLLLIKVKQIIGLDLGLYFQMDPIQLRNTAEQGEALLRERDLLRIDENNQVVLEANLLMAMNAILHPRMVTIVRRNTPGLGEQVVRYYESDVCIVEYSWPDNETHRLGLLQDQKTLIDRLTEIFPVVNSNQMQSVFQLDQSAFFKMKELAETGHSADATAIVSHYTSDEFTQKSLITTIQRPGFGGTTSMLRVNQDLITDARDLAIVQGDTDAWIMMQIQPGVPLIRAECVDLDRLREILVNLREGLSS